MEFCLPEPSLFAGISCRTCPKAARWTSRVSLATVLPSCLEAMGRARVSSLCTLADAAARLPALKAGFPLPHTFMEDRRVCRRDQVTPLAGAAEGLMAVLHARADRGLRTYRGYIPPLRQTATCRGQCGSSCTAATGHVPDPDPASAHGTLPSCLVQKPLFTLENRICRIRRAPHRRLATKQTAPRLSFPDSSLSGARAEIVAAFPALPVMIHDHTAGARQWPCGNMELHLCHERKL